MNCASRCRILQPGDHARQPVAALCILQHVNLVDHYRSYSPQALLGAYHLVDALVGPGYDVGIKTLGDLAAFSQANAGYAHPDGGLKSQFVVNGELIELLVGQGNKRHQKEQFTLTFQQILDPSQFSDQAFASGRGRDDQLVPAFQEACLNRPGLDRQEPGQSATQQFHELFGQVEGLQRQSGLFAAGRDDVEPCQLRLQPLQGEQADHVVQVPSILQDPGQVGLGSAAQMPEIRLSQQFCSSAVLADARSLVGYGLQRYISHFALPETMAADLNKPVFELVGLQQLDELLFQYRVSTGKIYGIRFAKQTHCVLGWKVLLRVGFLFDQKLEDPRPLRHILQSQMSFKKSLAAALGQ